MPSSGLYRKALFLVIFLTITGLLLFSLPIAARWLEDVFAGDSMMFNVIETVLRIVKIILSMAIVIAIVRFVAFLILRASVRNTSQSEVGSLLKTVLSIIAYIIAFFIIFQSQYPDVPLSGVFTGSTILGIVVGLALQDTLGNLFAGLALQADQSFQLGDVISIAGRGVGVVERVSWRGVKIRTFQNKLLVISNAALGKESIEVAPKDNLNARNVFFSTVYSQSPAKTAQIVREAVRQADNVSQKVRPVVRIRDLGVNGLDWEVKYWLEDYSKYNDTDALVRNRIWYAFQREKIDFGFPTQTLHIEPKPEEIPSEESVNTITEHLNQVSIFAPLSDEELEKLANASKSRVYAPGEAIVRMGQEGNSMYVIISGSVKVQIPEKSYNKTINNLKENDFFGEMSLLTGEPRTANVIAEEETEVLKIDKSGLKPLFESNPTLVHSICELIEERRELLVALDDGEMDDPAARKTGVIRSIRNFFGLKQS